MGLTPPRMTLPPVPPAPSDQISQESEQARRDMEERMRRVAMNRDKSKLRRPALVDSVQRRPPALMETLG